MDKLEDGEEAGHTRSSALHIPLPGLFCRSPNLLDISTADGISQTIADQGIRFLLLPVYEVLPYSFHLWKLNVQAAKVGIEEWGTLNTFPRSTLTSSPITVIRYA